MRCVLIGPAKDAEVLRVAAALEESGTPPVHWASDGWPGGEPLGFSLDADGERHRVGTLDLEQVGAVYLRSLSLSPQDPRFEAALEGRPFSLLSQLRQVLADRPAGYGRFNRLKLAPDFGRRVRLHVERVEMARPAELE